LNLQQIKLRKYSIHELDRMREIIRWKEWPVGVSWRGNEREEFVEEKLRTYMINGTTLEELEEHHKMKDTQFFSMTRMR